MAKMTSIIAASSFRGAPSANRESIVPTLEGVSLDDHSRNRGYGFRLLLASALGRNDERPSERNLVVHIAAAHRSGHGSSARRRRDLAGRARRAEIAAAGFVHVAAAASARAPRAIEQRQLDRAGGAGGSGGGDMDEAGGGDFGSPGPTRKVAAAAGAGSMAGSMRGGDMDDEIPF